MRHLFQAYSMTEKKVKIVSVEKHPDDEKRRIYTMTQIIIAGQGGQRKTYCVECADSKPEIQVELEKADAQDELEISDQPEDALGEECVSCQRTIDQVRAETRLYRVKATLTIEIEVDVEANSATDAQYAVYWALPTLALPEDEITSAMKEHIPATQQATVNDWTCVVEPAKVIPPEQNLFVTPTQERLCY